jgi:two-component system, cell cycle response regulator DivK
VRPFRILLVEDNKDLLELVVKYLTLCNWQTMTAANEDECWRSLEQEKPDLILMDMLFPGADAFNLVKALKNDARYKQVPVMAITGLNTSKDKKRCMIAGCDGVLTKPFHLDELRRRIQCYINRNDSKEKVKTSMKTLKAHLAAVAVLVFLLSGCQAMTGKTAGQNIDDAAISTSVQATLTADKASNFTRIDVDTNNGVVYLNGNVQNSQQKTRAEELARVNGVKRVVNNLQVTSK